MTAKSCSNQVENPILLLHANGRLYIKKWSNNYETSIFVCPDATINAQDEVNMKNVKK